MPPNGAYNGHRNPELGTWGAFPDEIYGRNTIWGNCSFVTAPVGGVSDWSSTAIPASAGFIPPSMWPALETEGEACEPLISPVGEDAAISPTWSWSQPPSPVGTFGTGTTTPPKPQSVRQTNSRSKQSARDSRQAVKPKSGPVLRSSPRKRRKASASTEASPPSPKNTRDMLYEEEEPASPEKVQARRNHNIVEKQYRNRLNAQFERLLSVLPGEHKSLPPGNGEQHHRKAERRFSNSSGADSVAGDRRLSKAEILDVATNRITELEADRERLLSEKKEILRSMEFLQSAAGPGMITKKVTRVGHEH